MDNLSSFTDILGDEIENSQPISLPSSTSSFEIRENLTSSNNNANVNRPTKGTGQYGEFRSVEEIDPKYRNIFSHSFFNVVQSRVIDDALYSDKSMVICAPTGSGKTVIFEMAIVQLLMSLDDMEYAGDFKIIYMAPVKALCTERLSEWYPKFTRLGLLCIEVTGDTDVDFSQLKPYRIIITTPEKWDVLTRRWRDHKSLVEVIKLFLIDEVHILNDETRGPVLEAVVSRMKTIESSVQSSHRIEQIQKRCEGLVEVKEDPPRIRFVAVSATVSNPEDVAAWLGTDDRPAVFYKFGDECRPVKLNRIVEGYPCAEGTSIFKFDIVLNYKLWPIIQKYHDGKPTLIFCNTRKSVLLTAETLSKELTINFNPEQKPRLIALASTMKNKKLQSLIMSGVGCHHAGMLFEERTNIEHSFRNRDLPILITTTTLAMGVNLPAHLVIIKNTQQYVNGAYQEYSISTVLQMVGRAGRPQFDTEATAVIMTRLADKHRYQALVGGNEPLQSFLHKRLTENLNSEAALGTVGDVAQCVQWLRSTFLFVRAARDPRRYLGLPSSAPQSLISKKIEELCVKAMNGLATSGLITMDEASCIESTDAGRLMSIYYLDVETMKNIMKIDGTENLERLLNMVCDSHELSDMHLRVDERRCLNALNRNNTAATIRFPMKGKISTRQMKLNCMIQAVLGCLPIPDPSLNQEAMKVMRIADRICKCLVSYVTRPDLVSQQPQYFSAILNSITLAKCVTAHLWENSPFVSKQLKGIGPTFSALLATAGKVNFMLLEESHPRDLERIMNKGPPAGNPLRKQITFLPKYHLNITPKNESTITIKLVLQNVCYLSENIEHLTAGETHKAYIIVGDSDNFLFLLTSFKDKDLIKVYDGSITYEITRKRNYEHKIFVHCVSSNFVGIDAQCEFTFKDLEIPLYTNIPTTTKKVNQKQTCITDVFKERKRKNENSLNIAQPKDKRKRDNSILEKFNELKEPFNETFDMLNKNIRQTNMGPEISNQTTLHEISSEDNTQILDMNVDTNNTNKLSENYIINSPGQVINLDDSEDEGINDDKLNIILDNIENEISQMNKTMKTQISTSKPITGLIPNTNDPRKESPIFNTPQTDFHKIDITRQLSDKFRSDLETYANIQKARKAKKVKSNYSFIDTLEKNNANIDEKENTIVIDNATGFSSAIKSNIDKYIETIQHSSKNCDNAINKILQNTNNRNLASEDMVQGHEKDDTNKSCYSSNQNFNLNSQHDSNTEISVDIYNLDDIVHERIPENKQTVESRHTDDELTPKHKIIKSNSLINNNTLIKSLQNKTSFLANVTDSHNDENVLKMKSNILDTKISNGLINRIDSNSNYESNNEIIQKSDITESSKYEEQRINENKFTKPEQTDFLDSSKINLLSENLFKIEKYANMTDYIRFTATSVSVKRSSENFVHIIKKFKVNLDISTTTLTNKMINTDTIINTSDQFAKSDDSLSMKEPKIAINALLPSVRKAIERTTEPISTNLYKDLEHPDVSHYESNEIENITKAYGNTTPSFTYELKEKSMLSAFNNLKETTCEDGILHNSGNITGVNEISKDNSINKDLTDLTGNNLKEISESDCTIECDQNNISAQKFGGNKLADILQKYSTLLRNNVPVHNVNQELNKATSSAQRDNNRQETKPDRPFKISDIKKLDIDLPQGLIKEISADTKRYVPSRFSVTTSTPQCEEECAGVQMRNCAEQIEHPIQVNEMDKHIFINEDSELQWVPEYCLDQTSDFNIHESMFDPKTLLQCLDNDNDDAIIAPPPEFCDKVDDHSINEIAMITSDDERNFDIFPDTRNLELRPCKEIEPRVISPKINYNRFTDINLIQTSANMNRNQFTNLRSHNPTFSRHNKLNKFKFTQKNKMKK